MMRKMSRGVADIVIVLVLAGMACLAGYGLFRYVTGMQKEVARLQENEKTLNETISAKNKEIAFLKELRESDEKALKELKEQKDKVEVQTKIIYRDKQAAIDGINKDPKLTPEQKKSLTSEAQIDSLWKAYCEVGKGDPLYCAKPTQEKK